MAHLQPGWTGRLGIALWLATLMAATASPSHAQSSAAPVSVLIVNQVSVEENILRAAQADVERLFAAIDVTITWHDQVPAAGRFYVVCITHEPVFAAPVSRQALGAVASSRAVRGVRAYVFYPRVVRAVARYATELSTVLGMAMAHELGHMLRPTPDHDPDGLMRATWTPREFALASRGALFFSRTAGETIRLTLRR